MKVKARLLALLCLGLTLAGCAAIPESTQPKPVREGSDNKGSVVAADPPKDIDPENLVRQFILASANSDDDFATAKPYLTKDAQKNWDTKGQVIILGDNFNTVPSPNTAPQDRDLASKQHVVKLDGSYFGRLTSADHTFAPMEGEAGLSFVVEKQPDGQWRIAQPPDGVYVTKGGFTTFYTPITLYFYNQDQSILVPDPRWVAGTAASTGLPSRAMDLLLAGPSGYMSGALHSALPAKATLHTNVSESEDGALVVDLSQLGDLNQQTKGLIAAQIVRSLTGLTVSRIRLQVDGVQMLPDRRDWRPTDIAAGDAQTTPSADLHGMIVAGGQVRTFPEGTPIKGAAGNGDYHAISAAQSLDGSELAVVGSTEQGPRLWVGKQADALHQVDLQATRMTRPTWMPSASSGDPSNEVWTVVDQTNVVQIVNVGDARPQARSVSATELTTQGPITDLRLSRDGARFAAVAGGRLVVGAVSRGPDGIATLRVQGRLQEPALQGQVTAVDWLSQEALVVGTSIASMPMAKVDVDGVQMDGYSAPNLKGPIRSVAAAPSRQFAAVDNNGLWQAADPSQAWRNVTVNGPAAEVVFYPG